MATLSTLPPGLALLCGLPAWGTGAEAARALLRAGAYGAERGWTAVAGGGGGGRSDTPHIKFMDSRQRTHV